MSKKKTAAVEVARIRQQLAAAGGDDIPYDVRWGQRVLAGEEAAPPAVLRPELTTALIDELVEHRAVATLSRLAGAHHALVAKAARTGLHWLRSHKVSVEIPLAPAADQAGTGLVEGDGTAPQQGLITMYDHRGQRLLWLTSPASKGLYIHQGRLSAVHGLVEFETYSTTRRKFRDLAHKVREGMVAEVVNAAVVRWFLEEGARVCQGQQRGVPQGFAAASQLLGPPPPGDHPGLAVEPVVDPTTAALQGLFAHRALALWVPERDFLQHLGLRLDEIATSRIVVDDRQREAQVQVALQRACDELYTPAQCAASRRVLLDTAHLLALGGDPAAPLARAAAEVFVAPRAELLAHPFARFFLERVLRRPATPSPAASEPPVAGGLIRPTR